MVVKEPESQYVLIPAGVHAAICVDEIDIGAMPNRFEPEKGPVQSVRLVWQLNEETAEGRPFSIKKDYRASLHEKAALRKDLENWRGKPFSFDELVGFDLEKIVGVCCLLNIVHKPGSKGGLFSNIGAIMPLPRGMEKMQPRDYVRMKDRSQPVAMPVGVQSMPRNVQQPPEQQPADWAHIDDDDVPF